MEEDTRNFVRLSIKSNFHTATESNLHCHPSLANMILTGSSINMFIPEIKIECQVECS